MAINAFSCLFSSVLLQQLKVYNHFLSYMHNSLNVFNLSIEYEYTNI